jgi:hypothetical protein
MDEDKIVSIEYVGEIETVDITTDGDHLFFGNDILTHNTSYEEIEFDPSHIAGGISKVNTADNVIGIFTSAAMKESGRYQIQFMKTRSSSGVGSKVDLVFNNKCLKISDLDESDNSTPNAITKNIYDQLKRSSTVKSGEKVDTNTGEITSGTKVDPLEGAASLRAFLKKRT